MNVPASMPQPTGSADWPSDWLRATLGFLALRALSAGPSYGYAIISELEHHGFGTIKGGTLYPLLTRYETAGRVNDGMAGGRRRSRPQVFRADRSGPRRNSPA